MCGPMREKMSMVEMSLQFFSYLIAFLHALYTSFLSIHSVACIGLTENTMLLVDSFDPALLHAGKTDTGSSSLLMVSSKLGT